MSVCAPIGATTTPSGDAMSVQECNCLAVRSAARHITQFSILAALGETAPLTIKGLAKVMVMDRTTLGRNVLPLERDGLIRIAPAAGDRRAKELHLTKAGA